MKKFRLLSLIVFNLILIGCVKDKVISNQDKILGTWISADKSDTLNFADNKNMYKSNLEMRHDHYDYQLDNDSLKIGYNGILYILVIPTKHKYYFDGNNLEIDFSNKSCYGFDMQAITYTPAK